MTHEFCEKHDRIGECAHCEAEWRAEHERRRQIEIADCEATRQANIKRDAEAKALADDAAEVAAIHARADEYRKRQADIAARERAEYEAATAHTRQGEAKSLADDAAEMAAISAPTPTVEPVPEPEGEEAQ